MDPDPDWDVYVMWDTDLESYYKIGELVRKEEV